MDTTNLLESRSDNFPGELFETIIETPRFTLERILSRGHATPPGQWLAEDRHEWVTLLSGAAVLRFADEPEARTMRPGDHLLIVSQRHHRVEWTDPDRETVWLALHYTP
jgi:cupin 2 domain-containing protein